MSDNIKTLSSDTDQFPKCLSTTKKGERCKNQPLQGKKYCKVHLKKRKRIRITALLSATLILFGVIADWIEISSYFGFDFIKKPSNKLILDKEPKSIKTLAIMPFLNLTDTTRKENSLGILFSEYFVPSVSKIPGFILVERKLIEKAISEIKFNAIYEEYFNPATIQRAGKLLGAQYIMTGTYWIDSFSCNINVRVIEVETGGVYVAVNSKGVSTSYFAVLSDAEEKLLKSLKLYNRFGHLLLEAKLKRGEETTHNYKTSEDAFIAGFQYEETSDLENAVKAYEAAIKMNKSFWEAHFNLGVVSYNPN